MRYARNLISATRTLCSTASWEPQIRPPDGRGDRSGDTWRQAPDNDSRKELGMQRKLRMGMVGGGKGAFIGDVHRKASRLDGKIELIAGAFDINPENSLAVGRE